MLLTAKQRDTQQDQTLLRVLLFKPL